MQCSRPWFNSGRSPGKEIGYPLKYSWASLVVQSVKNLPAMHEAWVWPLGWEDPPKEGTATYFSILAWGIPVDRGVWRAIVHGSQTAGHNWVAKYSTPPTVDFKEGILLNVYLLYLIHWMSFLIDFFKYFSYRYIWQTQILCM